jgi:predicted protein tyrosine phosphatase
MRKPRSAIHVCSLSRLHDEAARLKASHVLTLISDISTVATPADVHPDNHLMIQVNDIEAPQQGLVAPDDRHVGDVIAFARAWHGEAPLLVHCFAGISRSTAAAFISACTLRPELAESSIANHLRLASPTASPNRLMVRIADDLLSRGGRMADAIERIGRGEMTSEAAPFVLPLHAIA